MNGVNTGLLIKRDIFMDSIQNKLSYLNLISFVF